MFVREHYIENKDGHCGNDTESVHNDVFCCSCVAVRGTWMGVLNVDDNGMTRLCSFDQEHRQQQYQKW